MNAKRIASASSQGADVEFSASAVRLEPGNIMHATVGLKIDELDVYEEFDAEFALGTDTVGQRTATWVVYAPEIKFELIATKRKGKKDWVEIGGRYAPSDAQIEFRGPALVFIAKE